LIASHVIEHTTDLIGFLDTAATLLTPDGLVILAVPDKRYCFDYFQPLTTTGDVLDAHAERGSRHTRRVVFNQKAYAVSNGGAIAWGQEPPGRLLSSARSSRRQGHSQRRASTRRLTSTCTHGNSVPASFELILLELARLGEADWRVERASPATGCEFYVWLRRGGMAVATALTAAEVDACRLVLLKRSFLETREQVDLLLAHKPAQANPQPPSFSS
jgi:hypothetical protein